MTVDISQLNRSIPSVPQYVLNQLPARETSFFGFNLYMVLGVILVIIIVGLIFFLIIKKRNRSAENSPSSRFEECFKRGVRSLDIHDFKSAQSEYNKMKSIAEQTKDKKLIDKAMGFYKKYEGVLNEER
jgi:uncharacterized membrane protein